MSQKAIKTKRRALRRTALKEKNNIITRYLTENWDKVIVSSVGLIRSFKLKTRFSIAMLILFKPIKKAENKEIEAGRSNRVSETAPLALRESSSTQNSQETQISGHSA